MKKILLTHLLLLTSVIGFAGNTVDSVHVFQYMPAPGQYINTLPAYTDGFTQMQMDSMAQTKLNAGSMICLGAYGGYVILGTDSAIANIAGDYDFKIYGNAYTNNSEPGIVEVSVDANGDGYPNDTWYELAGSVYDSTATIHNYEITYHRPTIDTAGTITNYILWTDNQGDSGYVQKNSYHTQSYFPKWITEDSITFKGELLPNNVTHNGSTYTLANYAWGYVDNQPNNSNASNFKLEWAVDSNGNSVSLDHIDFIKIYTGVNSYNGWIGESSTEVAGIHYFKAYANPASAVHQTIGTNIRIATQVNNYLQIISNKSGFGSLFSLSGKLLRTFHLNSGENQIDMSSYDSGIYLLKISIKNQTTTYKVAKQ